MAAGSSVLTCRRPTKATINQIVGDIGGVFTATLDQTQGIYEVYDWDMNYFALGDVIGTGNGVVIVLSVPVPPRPPEPLPQ